MKRRVIQLVLACSLLSIGQQALSQLLPALQNAVEQQVERVTSATVDRSLEQVQAQVVERTVEQVQTNAVDRVVQQTGSVVEQVVVDRVVQQQVDAVQEQAQDQVQAVIETVQNQALEQVQATVEGSVSGAVENVVENTQGKALEQVQNVVENVQGQATAQVQKAVDKVQEQAVGQAQDTVENLQAQALDNVQGSLGQALAQVNEQAQAQVDKVQSQVGNASTVVERSQGALEQVQAQVTQVSGQVTDGAQDRAPGLDTRSGADAGESPADAGAVNAAVPPDANAPPAQRQAVLNTDGSAAFVEITLAPGVRAVEFEWLMVVTPEQRALLDAQAAELLGYLTASDPFALTGGELLTFTVPPDLDANDAILGLVPADLRGQIDRNHIYDETQHTSGLDYHAASLPLPMPAVCTSPVAVGVIDSAVDAAHPAFAKRAGAIHARSFVDEKLAQPAGHGTAIAGLLVGDAGSERAGRLHPLLPEATLYTAAVFHEQEGLQQGATLMRVLAALDWLVEQSEVRVINMSLAGPPNRLLEQAVTAANAKGKVVVAAAGNEGPYGPARYPAAYDAAIGVTAVDRASTVFRFANQGKHIDYAALGVEVPTALQDGSIGPGSGTSLAAPVISAFFACALAQESSQDAALAALDRRVVDLGLPGADPVYGRGLLHP